MNTNLRAGWLAAAFVLAAGWLSAQNSTREELQRADRQFDLRAYNLAMQTYDQVLKSEPRNAHALARIGDAHYQLNHPEKALEWYEQAIQRTTADPEVLLRYGKALMETGDYAGAKNQFLQYAVRNESVGQHYASVAEFALRNFNKEPQYIVRNEALNTDAADFGPAFFTGRVVYNSSRTDLAQKKDPQTSTEWSGGSFNHLYITQALTDNGQLQKPVFLRSDFDKVPTNEGPVSYSADGRRVVYGRNNFVNGTRQVAEKGMNMSLYIAEVEDGKWKNSKPFLYNGSDYAIAFPSLSPDGNTLLFASTQPGGFGGWDIYVSNYTAGGWSTPRNIGSPLNTAGNEVTPFFDGKNLYFSSDWHPGLGGLDVFRADLGREEVSNIYHLGTGINSPRDDYGFIYNSSDNIGYLTSTREGGRGNEDIWQVSKKWEDAITTRTTIPETRISVPETRTSRPIFEDPLRPNQYNNEQPVNPNNARMHVLVTDIQGNPLPDVDVDFADCYIGKGITGGDGKFYFDELLRTVDCNARLSKVGFREITVPLQGFGKQNVRVSLNTDRREEYTGKVLDTRTRGALRDVNVHLQVVAGDRAVQTTSDAEGMYSLFLEPDATYLITYSKYGYIDQIVKTRLNFGGYSIAPVWMERSQGDYMEYSGNTATRPREYDTRTTSSTTRIFDKVEQPLPQEQPSKFNGYSIQLAAMPEDPSEAKLRSYEELTKMGNLYVKSENELNKIRLGIFTTKTEADENLKKVLKNNKLSGSFIVEERGADESLVIGTPLSPVAHSDRTAVTKGGNGNLGVRYAVQLGSFDLERPIAIGDYAKLSPVGNLYTKAEHGATKVRMGVWSNHAEAELAKSEALKKGFFDAIIVTEKADDPSLKDFMLSPSTYTIADQKARVGAAQTSTKPTIYSEAVSYPYFIRIAALANPDRFDAQPLEDLGYIEKRRAENSPGMTIVLLAGFPTFESANAALSKVLDRGYMDSYVMKDEKGKLVRK